MSIIHSLDLGFNDFSELALESVFETLSEKQRNFFNQINKFALHVGVKVLFPNTSISRCASEIRKRQPVHIEKKGRVFRYSNIKTCQNVWACPICAVRVGEKKREQLFRIIRSHVAAGGRLYMGTFTVPHRQGDDLKKQVQNFTTAFRKLTAHRRYKNILGSLGCLGIAKALEVTYGVNGWHTHAHVVWFTSVLPQVTDYIEKEWIDFDFKRELWAIFPEWVKVVEKSGFDTPSPDAFSVENADYVQEYISKHFVPDFSDSGDGSSLDQESFRKRTEDGAFQRWETSAEMTRKTKKGSKKGKTPFQILRKYVLEGDRISGRLFQNYVASFSGRSPLFISSELKKRYDIEEEVEEGELEVSELIGKLTSIQYRKLLSLGSRGKFLWIIREFGFSEACRLLNLSGSGEISDE